MCVDYRNSTEKKYCNETQQTIYGFDLGLSRFFDWVTTSQTTPVAWNTEAQRKFSKREIKEIR